MGLGELNKAGIIVVAFGKKHEPETLIEPYFPNQRHSALLKMQINLSDDFKNQLWNKMIRQKIDNSSRNLAVLGLEGVKEIEDFVKLVHDGDKENIEAQAAAAYFQFYHKGLNRRNEDPVNSALNYGYAIVRSYIIKALISTGIELMVASFRNAFEQNQAELIKLPMLIGFKESLPCES